MTVGWVGDSRAYWVTPKGAELLTRDHSWVNEVVQLGRMTEEEAMRAPEAHTITRCLGPLEVGDTLAEAEPEVRARDVPGPGVLLLCTDGFWNYTPELASLSELLRAAGEGAGAEEIARVSVNHALSRGGHDNVSVAVYTHP
jgi:PPM family protein phosphatase